MEKPTHSPNRLRILREEKGWSRKKLAQEVQSSYGQITKLESGERGLSLDWMERLSGALGTAPEELIPEELRAKAPPRAAMPQTSLDTALSQPHNHGDNAHLDQNFRLMPDVNIYGETWRNTPFVPQYGTSMAGEDGAFEMNTGEVLNWIPRPSPKVSHKVYCIRIEGSSMEDHLEDGDLVFVDSSRKPLVGRFAVLQFNVKAEGEGPRSLIKRVVAINSEFIRVKQYNPAKEWNIPTSSINSAHLVLNNKDIY